MNCFFVIYVVDSFKEPPVEPCTGFYIYDKKGEKLNFDQVYNKYSLFVVATVQFSKFRVKRCYIGYESLSNELFPNCAFSELVETF